MFNDDDFFGLGVHRNIQRQFREMDRMMNAMMDPFGMLGGMGMLEGPQRGSSAHQMVRPFDPFRGFGGLFSAMEDMQERAMSDPRTHVYSQSTMVSFGNDGQPRVIENSVRKSGDVKETRRSVRDGAREEVAIGHTIGDRTHIIEKKRDKDGKVRRQQKFVNLDEAAAEDFDREFQSRARASMNYNDYNARRALGDGSSTTSHRYQTVNTAENLRTKDSAPIITLPEEDEDEEERSASSVRPSGRASRSGGGYTGPVIREISEEEAESSIPKRRRGFAGFFRANDE